MNITDGPILFQVVALLFCSGLLSSLAFRLGKKAGVLSFGPPMAGSILLITLSVLQSLSGSRVHVSDPFGAAIPAVEFDFYIDGMSAFFMLILGVVTLAVSTYSLGYASEYLGKRSMRSMGFLFNLFVLSMLLVIASNSIFTFVIFWELMSLSSFFLVIYDHEDEMNIRSGMTYLIMTHFGTAFILASFLAFYIQTGSFTFDSFRNATASIPAYVKDVAFILAFVGFGTKAGLVPFHRWLPQAHPSAPSNVSAMMSAVMIKVAIYGLVRTVFDFSGPTSPDNAWWGMVLTIAGAVSCVIGVLYAAIEKDIKKALAYSSIENVGMIILGIGLAVIFQSFGLASLAGFALLASMYHSLNHAVFKSLLFMGAGSVVLRTHAKNMDQLGGLIKKMPVTAFLFLVGAVAISGLPPLNGFVSEWLTFQALLSSHQLSNLALQISISIVTLVFALAVGLTLATFVKIFGITFLARPRTSAAANAKEVPRTMIAGMGIVAGFCIILGIMSFGATNIISGFFGLDKQLQPLSPFNAISVPLGNNFLSSTSISPGGMALMMGCVALFFIGLLLVLRPRNAITRTYGTWDCGFGQLGERTQYSAGSLSQPLRVVFKSLYKPHSSNAITYYAETNRYLKESAKVETHTKDIFDDWLYRPLIKTTIAALNEARKIQTGRINAYLLYVMVALVAMLILTGVLH